MAKYRLYINGMLAPESHSEKNTYEAGEEVKLKIFLATDTNTNVTSSDVSLGKSEYDGGALHYCFKMPENDVHIDVSHSGGMRRMMAKYRLYINGILAPESYSEKNTYEAGEEVKLRIYLVTDMNTNVTSSDVFLGKSEYDGGALHYCFKMPENDVHIDVSHSGGMRRMMAKYRLYINGILAPESYSKKNTYEAGEEVKLRVFLVTDMNTNVTSSDVFLGKSEYDGGALHYCFKMPENDVHIDVSHSGGMMNPAYLNDGGMDGMSMMGFNGMAMMGMSGGDMNLYQNPQPPVDENTPMTFCSECGSRVPDQAFCAECGYPLKKKI